MKLAGIDNLDELIKMAEKIEITDEMRNHFDKRTEKHINLVRKYCKKIAEVFGDEFKEIIERGELHDASKKEAPELEPYIYVTWDYKCKGDGDANGANFPEHIKEIMNTATEHHVHKNTHHPESHCPSKEHNTINREDRDAIPDKMVDTTAMPALDIAEMCADWCAMSEEKGNSPQDWAKMNVNKRWKFTNEQEKMIYKILNNIWGE